MEPIAIIGMSCRFPGAINTEAYWQVLRNGVDVITEIPSQRWNLHELYHPDPEIPGKTNSRWGGFLQQVDQFDPHFFGLSPREAVSMDPQQRLLLEVAWEALEDAGQVRENLSGSQTGVFIGISTNDYSYIQPDYANLVQGYDLTGNASNIAAGRLSYLFNFRGPSMAIDTACSSSLVAVHLACQSLRNQEATLALAGGVNIILSPIGNIGLTKLKALSPDGRCKTFDAQANGYVRSEGCGMIVLKPLSQALADNDPIYALIRGSAVNHDGRAKGLTVPYGPAQEAVIRQALNNAEVQPSQISYVELHGTGTSLGDPIEAIALGSVLAVDRPPESHCAVGAVKSNIGHLEAAAGIASLIKVALSLKHQQIPPSLHFQQPNPYIPFDTLPLRIQQTLQPWPQGSSKALAGVSSFGFAGTNAHVILEQTPLEEQKVDKEKKAPIEPCAYLLPLSAHSPEALKSLAQAYQNFLTDKEPHDALLRDICYTTGARRTHHNFRFPIISSSLAEVNERLQDFLEGASGNDKLFGRKQRNRRQKLVFVFSGQGPQWWAMGRELLQQEPVFRAILEECDTLIKSHTNWSVLQELAANESQSRLNETEIAQPALFAVQVALANLWQSWGIKPNAVVGHSLGEVAAAHIAGVLSLADAVHLICHRGRLMQRATGNGKMATVELPSAEIEVLLSEYKGRLSIAAINSPTSTVVSGEAAALESLLQHLAQQEIFYKLLPVNYAFHSIQMESFEGELVRVLQGIKAQSPTIPIYSTVTGQSSQGENFDAAYWGKNLKQPVFFKAAIEGAVKAASQTVFLEISPHPVLSHYISQCLSHLGQEGSVLPSLRRGQAERETMLTSLGQLYTLGYQVNWNKLYPSGCQVVHLPSYPWQRERYWFEHKPKNLEVFSAKKNTATHPLLGQRLHSALKETLFESLLNTRVQPFLADHQVYETVVLPGAAYLEMAVAAATTLDSGPYVLRDVSIQEALVIPQDTPLTVQLILTPEDVHRASFQILSLVSISEDDPTSWKLHATGKVYTGETDEAQTPLSLKELQARCHEELSQQAYYKQLRERGLEYGPSFQGIEQLWRGDGEALGRIRLPEALVSEAEAYQIHPVLIDSGLQLLFATLSDDAEQNTYLPVGLENFQVYRRPENKLWIHGQMHPQDGSNQEIRTGDLHFFNDAGQIIAEVHGLQVKRVNSQMLRHFAQKNLSDWLYEVEWQPKTRVSNSELTQAIHSGSWLLFADRGGVANALAKLLLERGETCIIVYPDEVCEVSEQGHWKINPALPENFQHLFEQVLQTNKVLLRGVVYLWGLDSPPTEAMTADSFGVSQTRACMSVVHLVQALMNKAHRDSAPTAPRLWLVTRGSQSVKSSPMEVAQATLWGLGRVIALEHPEIWGGLLDLDTSTSSDEASTLLAEIWQPDGEDHLSFRGGQRYVARLVRSNYFDKPAEPWFFRKDATYLVTGGLGGLGLKVARWMVEQGARNLVLVGRSGVSSTISTALTELHLFGAQVLVVKADVSQKNDVVRLLREITESMPPLQGIIHAAGVLDDGMLLQQSWERFTKVMAPKIEGAWNLHVLTQDMPLDFFVLFSSVSSLLGSPGQGNYAAANAFLDALAHYRRAQGLPGLSINWGSWAEVGMAANLSSRDQHRLAALGMDTIALKQGLQVLQQVFQQPCAQVAVVPVKWLQFIQQYSNYTVPPLLNELAREVKLQVKTLEPSVQQREFLSRLQKALPRDRQELLLTHIRDQVSKVLGLASSHSLEAHQGFFNIGMDSLTSVELKNRLQTSLERSLPSTLIFDYPTLDSLAGYLVTEIFAIEPVTNSQLLSHKNISQQTITLTELEQISEDDAEALLLEEIESFELLIGNN